MGVAENRQPVRIDFQHLIEGALERFDGLIGQAVDKIDVDGFEAKFAQLLDHALRLRAWLDAVDGQLHLGIKILHADGGTIEPGFPKGQQMVRRDAARVDFHTGFEVGGQWESLANGAAQFTNLRRLHECRCAAAPVQLHNFPFRIQHSAHLSQLLAEISQIRPALLLLLGDDRRAAAIPAEALAERDVKVEGHISFRAVVREDFIDQSAPRGFLGESCGRRIRCVARAGNVVFTDEIEVERRGFHEKRAEPSLLNSRTVRTTLAIFSSGVAGGTPWPRLKM